jgi:hypothetical protein
LTFRWGGLVKKSVLDDAGKQLVEEGAAYWPKVHGKDEADEADQPAA